MKISLKASRPWLSRKPRRRRSPTHEFPPIVQVTKTSVRDFTTYDKQARELIRLLSQAYPNTIPRTEIMRRLGIGYQQLYTILDELTYRFPIYEEESPSGRCQSYRIGILKAQEI